MRGSRPWWRHSPNSCLLPSSPVMEPVIHDGAPRLHIRDGCLRHVEIAEDVGAESFFELLFGKLFDGFLVLLKRGIVDEDVELSEFVQRLLDGLPAKM